MSEELIPDDVRCFILTGIDSVPYLESLLLFRGAPQAEWNAEEVAQKLYTNVKTANELLSGLCAAGFLAIQAGDVPRYCYSPASAEMREMAHRLAAVYAKQLVAVTNLIHAKPVVRVHQFADAFKLRREE